MKSKKNYAFYFILFAVLLIIDQWSKIYIKTHFFLGEEVMVIPHWFRIAFTENPGAAFGMELGGSFGKYVLSIFRVIFSIGIAFYLIHQIKNNVHKGFLIGLTFILAGAIGNVIDGVFYGMIFSESSYYHTTVAKFVSFGTGYAGVFQGKVVDMLYFPMINGTFPEWMPSLGGQSFTFFSPIFNIADSCITVGLGILIYFLNKVEL